MSCASCGADEHDLAPVHRKYLTIGPGELESTARVLDDVELWCVPCRTQYPHEPFDR